MARVQLFEFHDLEWFPTLWRNMMTDLMSFFAVRFDPFRPIVPKLKEALVELQCTEILDLCSGASGPLLSLQRRLEKEQNYSVTVTMSDKYPNRTAFGNVADASRGKIKYIESSVDATDVPEGLRGFRTLFTSFHHFAPDTARKILADAERKRVGIGVFEYTEPTPIWFLAILFSPLLFVLLAPFIYKPCTWGKLFWTYLIPLPLLLTVWDGIVSCLRTYPPEELRKLASGNAGDYHWDIGKMQSFGACRITYMIGIPKVQAAGFRGC